MAARTVLLLVADDPARRTLLHRALERPDLEIAVAADLGAAEAALQRASADVALVDLCQPGRDVSALMHVLHGRAPELPVVSLGSAGGPEAVELLRQGAWAVVPRDAEPAAIGAWLRRAAEAHAQGREVARLRRETRGQRDRVPLLGRSERMRAMSQQVDELATRNVAILLVGESGTGRKMVARELHARSPRASGPYVAIGARDTCERLLESQLFGHRRGAFPGAAHDHDGGMRAASGGPCCSPTSTSSHFACKSGWSRCSTPGA
jgi:DNA-binding NtrC family response regulator